MSGISLHHLAKLTLDSLQPGCSSMEGIISEHGVWTWYGGTFAPVRNPWAWANLTNIVYIDQPVGSGFSVGNASITNEEELAQQFLGFWDNRVMTSCAFTHSSGTG